MNKPLFWVGLLGGVKLIADSFGYSLFTDDQINSIANGFATVFIHGNRCLREPRTARVKKTTSHNRF